MMAPFQKEPAGVRICFDGTLLSADTGKSLRRWKLANGLKTVFFGFPSQERNLLIPTEDSCDWHINACEGSAELLSIDAELRKANYRMQEHAAITAVFLYREANLLLRFEINCFAGIPGFRTQLGFRSIFPSGSKEFEREKILRPSYPFGWSESLGIDPARFRRLLFGYAADAQHRGFPETPILTEYRFPAESVNKQTAFDNANGLILTNSEGDSIIMVKESNKCTNNHGIATGEFVLKNSSVCSTGLGFTEGTPHWLEGGEFQTAWANWTIPAKNDVTGAADALKHFDRARYPFRKERDMVIASNTWASRGGGELSRTAAEEQNVIEELKTAKELGIDLVQIDDGWQFNPGTSDFWHCKWTPSPVRFPSGWDAVREEAEKCNVKLGLWFPHFTPLEKILENRKKGNFKRIKLDFLHFNNRQELDAVMKKADALVKEGYPYTGINWDITENSPRIGFFFAREYGNLFLQNCENSVPGGRSMEFIAYDPEITLRQTWHLARYCNLNQFQITIQRSAESCRAQGYDQDYAVGIALMGNPLFFVETQRFSEEERCVIRTLLRIYKGHREKILDGFVSPVGEEPDGKSICGFLCVCSPEEGYLTLFREKNASEATARLRLDIASGAEIELEGLYNGKNVILHPDSKNEYVFPPLPPASFAFYRWKQRK